MPIRIQRKRTKGWSMPPDATYVGRPTRWANPCRVGMFKDYTTADAVRDYQLWIERDPSVRTFDNAFGPPPSILEVRAALRGKNLACWCRPSDPCHADVLLEIANA